MEDDELRPASNDFEQSEANIIVRLGAIIIRWGQTERALDLAVIAAHHLSTAAPIKKQPKTYSDKLEALKQAFMGAQDFTEGQSFISEVIEPLEMLVPDRHVIVHGYCDKTEIGPPPFIRFEKFSFKGTTRTKSVVEVSEQYLKDMNRKLVQILPRLRSVHALIRLHNDRPELLSSTNL